MREIIYSDDDEFLNNIYSGKKFKTAEPKDYMDLETLEYEIEHGNEPHSVQDFLDAGFKIEEDYFGNELVVIPKNTVMTFIKSGLGMYTNQYWDVNGIEIYIEGEPLKLYPVDSLDEKLLLNNKSYISEAFNELNNMTSMKDSNKSLKESINKNLKEDMSNLSYEDAYDFLYPIVHDEIIGHALDNLSLELASKYPDNYDAEWCNMDGSNSSADEVYAAQDKLTEVVIADLLYNL